MVEKEIRVRTADGEMTTFVVIPTVKDRFNRDAAEPHFERTLDLWRRNLPPEPVQA
jgi:hypothetical protein